MREDRRKFIAGLITGLFVFGALTFYALETRAVNPSITYASPSNGATFVSVWRGHGVNITVNVTDADGDLNQVVLKWNDSGTWKTFYDSGALGGVSYHNVTVLNTNFTGSWKTYEWQICAYDTAWTNTTYEFTTEYTWGDPIMIFGDFRTTPNNMDLSVIYKNDTGEYYLWVGNASLDAKRSSQGWDWITISKEDVASGGYPYNVFIYNGQFYLCYSGGQYYYYATWNGTGWNVGSMGIKRYRDDASYYYDGASVIYYNGKWNFICGRQNPSGNWDGRLTVHEGTPPSTWTVVATLDSSNAQGHHFYVSSAILDGLLVVTYKDGGNDLHWQTYNGISWTDKGDIETDIGSGCSMVKDPVNNQLVCVYINASGNMYYRILTDPDGTWSEPHLIFQPESGYSIKYPHVSYIDHRLVITFAYNIRGNYNIYMISAPEYVSSASNILKQYNRIQFPDATPNQKNVNSSVFYYKNINSRNITWINWSFSDIGSIQCENNIRLWGSTDNITWTLIGTTDANGYINMTTTTWASGLPWETGDKRYFKIEILDIGAVPEDLHNVDEGIILKVGLA